MKEDSTLSKVFQMNRADTIKDRAYYVWERKYKVNKEFTESIDNKINIYKMDNKPCTKEEIKILLEDIKYRQAFFTFVSFYETLAFATLDGFYDYRIIKELGGLYLIKLYDNVLKSYLEVRKDETNLCVANSFDKLIDKLKLDLKI